MQGIGKPAGRASGRVTGELTCEIAAIENHRSFTFLALIRKRIAYRHYENVSAKFSRIYAVGDSSECNYAFKLITVNACYKQCRRPGAFALQTKNG